MNTKRLFGQVTRAFLMAGVAAGAAAPALAQVRPDDSVAGPTDTGVQDQTTPTVTLGNEIIVTATKRAQTLQDTPVAVTVTTGETLERAEIRDLLDLQTVAPSLRVGQLQNSSNTTFFIRGFGNGDNNVGVEPSVAVFIDGVYRSRSAGQIADLANVARVEVLRGPQSTLFGKNASAGVISVITREPQFEFGGSVSATYGNFNQVVIKGDVTGPITDSLAFSIDGNYNRRDGYVEVVGFNDRINDRNRWSARGQLLFDNGGALRLRAIGDYQKISELCCYAGNLVAGPTVPAVFAVGGAIVPEDLFADRTFLNVLPENDIESYGGSLQADLQFGNLTLTSITAYRELRSFFNQDVDFTGADLITEFRDQKIDTFTQEVRLASDFAGPLNFLLGGFFFKEDITQDSSIVNGVATRPFFTLLSGGALPTAEAALGIPAGAIFRPGPSTVEAFALQNESWSIFGQVDFDVTDRLTLTGGFNYTKDRKDFQLSQVSTDPLANVNLVDAFIVGGIAQALRIPPAQVTPAVVQQFAGNPATAPIFQAIAGQAVNPATNPLLALRPLQFLPPFLNLPNAVEPGRTRDDDWSYTLRAAYDINDQLNAYFTYATGFKASSVNLSRDSRPFASDFTPGPLNSTILAPRSAIRDAGLAIPNLRTGTRFAGPEESEVYEIGVKGSFPGLTVNLALFDQTLQGFQSNIFTGTGFSLVNAGQQSTRGFELDTTIQPIDPLVFTFALTYLDAKFDSFVDSPFGDLSGQRPAGVPEFSIATSATYAHDLGGSGNQLIGRIDYYHESNTQILNGLLGFPTLAEGIAAARNFRREINQVNASLTLALVNGLEVSAFVRNLTNERYILSVFDGVAQAGTVSGYPNQPRTYGVTGRFRF
ncbi:TonB-dependent receptor [Erythrobacteraceae bacterium CFH 75059]|uniref:TonB-dependent receptor n=1 Tax=Qipengyuania thermophila TaxID=2509361 RepID=UPI00101F1DD9|nr:TonB-dependent receptor [Qipengyuania thermophila]TCD06357.1 TonB-dependent receptor [Erythrobacteraceae bacterium CFH 75059]